MSSHAIIERLYVGMPRGSRAWKKPGATRTLQSREGEEEEEEGWRGIVGGDRLHAMESFQSARGYKSFQASH